MKAKIDKNGNFMIERAGVFKQQGCPFSQDAYCGDWCPLFAESIYFKNRTKDMVHIELCQKMITLKKQDFVDERKNS